MATVLTTLIQIQFVNSIEFANAPNIPPPKTIANTITNATKNGFENDCSVCPNRNFGSKNVITNNANIASTASFLKIINETEVSIGPNATNPQPIVSANRTPVKIQNLAFCPVVLILKYSNISLTKL